MHYPSPYPKELQPEIDYWLFLGRASLTTVGWGLTKLCVLKVQTVKAPTRKTYKPTYKVRTKTYAEKYG